MLNERRETAREARDLSLNESNNNLLKECDLQCAKDFLVASSGSLATSRSDNDLVAYMRLRTFIMQNVQRFYELSKVEKVVIENGLDLFADSMPTNIMVITDSRWRNSCPLEITTDYGSGGYVIKIESVPVGLEVLKVFIPAGQTYRTRVPDGTFVIKYLQGDKWYGNDIMFGYKCSASKADKHFVFGNNEGYTIKLYRVVNGNLTTSTIGLGEF